MLRGDAGRGMGIPRLEPRRKIHYKGFAACYFPSPCKRTRCEIPTTEALQLLMRLYRVSQLGRGDRDKGRFQLRATKRKVFVHSPSFCIGISLCDNANAF